MTAQLLIYRDAVPVSRDRHADCFIESDAHYAFSSAVNSVPLMAVEFPLAAAEYPVVFGGSETEPVPVAVLGIRGDENLFLGEDGTWTGKYVPAFIRRYPFVFSTNDDRLVLCIDEAFPGLNRDGRGARLFNADGTVSAYVEGILTFLQDYQAQFAATRRFCDQVKQLGLLEPMQAEVKMTGGETVSLSGFSSVNREKLKALPAETLSALAKSDELELLYLHMHSIRHFDVLGFLLEQRMSAAKGAV